MRLFENGIGRPSNEIKRKRKIFVICTIIICIALILIFACILTKNSIEKFQGAAQKQLILSCQASRTVGNPVPCSVTSNGKAVTGVKVSVVDSSIATIKNINSNKYEVTFNENLFSKYSNQIKTKSNKRYINSKVTASKYGYKTAIDYVEVYEKENLILTCPTTVLVNQEFSCTTNVDNVTITSSSKEGLAKGYKSSQNTKTMKFKYTEVGNIGISASKAGYKQVSKSIKVVNNLELNCPSTVAINQEFTCTSNIDGVTIEGSNENELVNGYKISEDTKTKKFKYKKEKTISVTAKVNNKSVKKQVKVEDKIYLSCPSSAWTENEFKCTTNLSGVKITAGGANSLASGYNPSQTMILYDRDAKFKYTNRLYDKYKNLIIEDYSFGNTPYLYATITASKEGYKKVSKKVMILKNKDQRKLAVYCPDMWFVDEEFSCLVNQEGVKVTLGGKNSLASGYSNIGTSTTGKYVKKIKYSNVLFKNYKSIIKKDNYNDSYINAQVTVQKGNDKITKNVKIYEKKLPRELEIKCSSAEVVVGERITCTTNQAMVEMKTIDADFVYENIVCAA